MVSSKGNLVNIYNIIPSLTAPTFCYYYSLANVQHFSNQLHVTTVQVLNKIYTAMKLNYNPNWLITEFQAHIEPPPIPLIKSEEEEQNSSNTIKFKMRLNLALPTSETCKLKMDTF